MLPKEKRSLIQEFLRSLAATQAAAVAEIQEKIAGLLRDLGLDADDDQAPNMENWPKCDATRFCVEWRGQVCFLGNTLLFWMFVRLAQSPNRYVSYVDLLDDVWRGQREESTIRGVAKRLRDRLVAAEMAELATAIDGQVSGYYGLILV